MRDEATERVREALTELVDFLDATGRGQGPDATLATRAAANIRSTIAALEDACDRDSLREAFRRAWYDTSAKGMFDWLWSPATEVMLQTHAERVGEALDRADRRARRNAPST